MEFNLKDVNNVINKSLDGIKGEEKAKWYRTLSKLSWVSKERDENKVPTIEALKNIRDISIKLSPNNEPYKFIENLIESRKAHPGNEKTALDGDEFDILNEFNNLTKLGMSSKEVDIFNKINNKYIGLGGEDIKAEFIAMEFNDKEDAIEFTESQKDLQNITDIIKTEGGYIAFSYDSEDYPPFLAVMAIQLGGNVIDDKKTLDRVKRDYQLWTEETGLDYWKDAVRLSKGVMTKGNVLVGKTLDRFMDNHIRRDDPDIQF